MDGKYIIRFNCDLQGELHGYEEYVEGEGLYR